MRQFKGGLRQYVALVVNSIAGQDYILPNEFAIL